MRLAVIDHIGNFGGGSRFILNLLLSFKRRYPHLQIVFFANSQSVRREALLPIFKNSRIEFKALAALQLPNSISLRMPLLAKAIKFAQQKVAPKLSVLPPYLSGNLTKELEQNVRGFDLAYFGWPFFLDYPHLECPVVATFHDFNFKYFFGSRIFNEDQIADLERQIPVWLAKATPIVSSHFMKSEIQKFYPAYASKAKVIHLAPFCGAQPIEPQHAQQLVQKLGLKSPYVIYPTNLCSHKNIGPLVAAIFHLWQKGHCLTLLLTGFGTEAISGRATPTGIEVGSEPRNVLGLGYVTNEQMNALIKCASAVVSTSLYEAGNGPGVDAWAMGTPVAMSDLPFFTEHIRYQNVHAELFNPRDPLDISKKLLKIIRDPQLAENAARRSQAAISRITWSSVAERYLEIFKAAIQESKL